MIEKEQTEEGTRTFSVASDETISQMILSARANLVVAAPALGDASVEALISRLSDRASLTLSIIIDADPEVYRLGYGSERALRRLHEACLANDLALRKQPGLRVGVIVADDACMIFSPTPQLIEAGSKTPEKPNALILRGSAPVQISGATSGDRDAGFKGQEIGSEPMRQGEIQATIENLKESPPQQFDIARALRVFSSKVQYVEFEAVGYKLDRKVVPLPDQLNDVNDSALRDQISSRIRSPLQDLASVELEVARNGKTQKVKVDGRWLDSERKRIEDEFLYGIAGFGKVILHTKREGFKSAVEEFEDVIKAYIAAVKSEIGKKKEDFVSSVVKEYAPRWTARPPKFYSEFAISPTKENIEQDLKRIAEELFDKSIEFKEPKVRIVPKNIAPETIKDQDFKKKVEVAFRKRNAPESLIQSLFEDFDAAPAPATQTR